MASFISALSLFILVLSNGCFTLPILNEQLSSSTFSSLNDDLTTGRAVNLRLVPDDDLSKEKAAHALRTVNEYSTSEPITSINEQSSDEKRDYDDLSFTTVEPITHVDELKQRDFISELEDETQTKDNKREIEVELTTSDMLLFVSTSSAVAPELYTSESSTSTERYTVLSKDKNEHEHEHRPEPEQTTKYIKTPRKAIPKSELTPPIKSKVQLEDKSEEDSKELTTPTAIFDQEALNKISNISRDFVILDEHIEIVVTDLPDNISRSTIENKKEEKPLNQGEESLHTEEKKSNH